MIPLLLLPLLANLWSCSAFSPAPHPHISHRSIDTSSFLAASNNDEVWSEESEQVDRKPEVSRRSAVGRAAVAAALTTGVVSPDAAKAYDVPIMDQVRAIENANYMVSSSSCAEQY